MCWHSLTVSLTGALSNRRLLIVEINYSLPVDDVKQYKADTQRLIDECIDRLGLRGMGEYDCILAITEYLCDTVTYPDESRRLTDGSYPPLCHSAYGAFSGDAVCEGYARAAQALWEQLGHNGRFIHGDCFYTDESTKAVIPAGPHAWNLVQVEGEWYQLDITWADQETYIDYDYFLTTDDFMSYSRTWDVSSYPASAASPFDRSSAA